MKIIEQISQDGPFGEYRIELSAAEREDKVDAKTFRALGIVESIYNRYGLVIALLAAVPLAIWTDVAE